MIRRMYERKELPRPAREEPMPAMKLIPPPQRPKSWFESSLSMFSRYGFLGMIRLVRDTLMTNLCFPAARILRWPWYLRGMRHIRIGRELTAGVGLRLDAFSEDEDRICINIGSRVEVNDHVHIGAVESVTIGDDVLIASRVFITDHDHGCYGGELPHSSPDTRPADRELLVSPVKIGGRVWLGEGVTVLPGVTIGEGAVIGANAVVTRDIPSNCLALGIPAKVVKRYDPVLNQWVSAV